MQSQLQKAFLETESGTRLACMFNPARLQFSLSNRWGADHVPGRGTAALRYAGSGGGSFDLALVFDGTDDGTPVTKHTGALLRLMEVDTSLPGYDKARNNGRPPWVRFRWGRELHSFKAVVRDLSVTYTYFSADGLPLRANVDMTLEQFEPDASWGPQNPTSGTPRPARTHQVQVGESLDRIAARHYGDPTVWRLIADANRIADPAGVAPGTLLTIPERDA